MQGHHLLRTLAVLLVLFLLAPLAPLPGAGADDATQPPPFRPVSGLEGPRATLRLYGCGDSLAETPPGTLATRSPDGSPTDGASDGRLDCEGDRVHLGHALLESAREPAHRQALGPRDQTIAASLRYLPVAWSAGPDHPGGVSDLVDPTVGLFDTDGDGTFDPAPPPGATPAADGTFTPTDHAPRDGRPDQAPRGTGIDGDRYFPALEARYDLVWTAGANTPVPVPAKASFLLPVGASGGRPGIDDWGQAGKRPVHWHPTPFGFGSQDDGTGALHTGRLTLKQGDEVWFLDHGVRVTGFFGTPEDPRVGLEVLYNGGGTREVLERSLILAPSPSDPSRHASLDGRAATPTNAVFADRTGIDRNIPPFEERLDAASDAAWFALVSGVTRADGSDTVTLRLGRVVATEAPWNAFVADRVLHRFQTVDERAGALHMLGLTTLHPLDGPVDIASAAITLAGLTRDDPFPFLPPFDRDHIATPDLRPRVERDAAGFLTGTGPGRITSDGLALRPDARTPSERAVQRSSYSLQWRSAGQEDRFVVPVVDLANDERLTVGALLPSRYVEVVLPDGRYRVDSVLLDDTAVLEGATEGPASPRAHRSFLFDPQDAPPLFAAADGLRLASGTIARPDAGDLVRFDPALLRWEDYSGRIRTPDRLADEAVRLALGFEAFVRFDGAAGLVPVTVQNDSGLQDGALGVHDHLWDVRPRAPGPDPPPYAPALRAHYTFAFLDRTTLEGLSPPLGARTGLLLPVADRDPAHPGLDAFDMVGNGEPDEVLLRGYWDLSRPGGARDRLTTGGTFVHGNASTEDLLWVQSRAFTIAPGVALQFFDHGVRFDAAEIMGDGLRPHLTLLDHRGPGQAVEMARVTDARVQEAGCLAVQWDHRPRDAAEACAALQVAPAAGGRSPTAGDVLWWVEVQAVSEEAVTLTMNRVVSAVDRDPPGDDRRMWAGGQLYSWDDLRIDGDRITHVALSHFAPLGDALEVTRPDGAIWQVRSVPEGWGMPLIPPFGAPYRSLQIHDVAIERNAQGFLDGRGDPADPDAVLAARSARTEVVDPLVVRFDGIEHAPRHQFLFLDPTRGWDPGRNGIAFTNGHWAEPWAGRAQPAPHAALAVSGDGAFEEALRRGDDRGWDQLARLTLEGPSRVVVDSARLGVPSLTARVVDQGAGQPGGTTTGGFDPNDPRLITETGRGSGLWVFRLFDPSDLYVGFLQGDARPTPTSPTPTDVPNKEPEPTVPWPTRTTDPANGTTRDGPIGVPVLVLALLLATLVMVRRRR